MLNPLVRRLIDGARPPEAMTTVIVAVDGFGGAGKSTLAEQIAAEQLRAGRPVTIVHTDDFASWDNPVDWWPRLLEQVLQPLSRNQTARYQQYDWNSRTLADWHEVQPGGLMVLEGVTASRDEFRPYLAATIWVETSADLRLRRGLERDGEQARGQWQEWMAVERRWAEATQPWTQANLVVPGS